MESKKSLKRVESVFSKASHNENGRSRPQLISNPLETPLEIQLGGIRRTPRNFGFQEEPNRTPRDTDGNFLEGSNQENFSAHNETEENEEMTDLEDEKEEPEPKSSKSSKRSKGSMRAEDVD